MFTKEPVWDEGWVPEDLHSRSGELQALAAALAPITDPRSDAPEPVILAGPPGAGKTASARYALQDLNRETRVRTALVDAWENHRAYQTYGSILDKLGANGFVRPQTPHHVLRDRVRDAVPDAGVVIVLDEADQLDDPTIVVDLNAMEDVAVVTIVNDEAGFRSRLEQETGEHVEFQESIQFDGYGEPALVDILRPRASLGLRTDVYDEEILHEVAAISAGNAREAIQGLRAAAEHAQEERRDEITSADVTAGHEAAVARIRQKTRSRLQRHERVVLEVIEDYGPAKKSKIYEEYVSRIGSDARSQRRVGDYISKLDSYNLIRARGESRARTYEVIAERPTSTV